MMDVNDFSKKQILFVFLNEGEKLSFANDNLVVRDKNNKIKHQSTCYRIFALFVVGNFTLTTGLIQRSHKFGFPIILMNQSMKPCDVIGHRLEGNTILRKQQYSYEKLDLARHIVENKIQNQRCGLNRQRQKSDQIKEAIRLLDNYVNEANQYNGELAGLLGFEGAAARLYFKHVFNNVTWNGRKPRIKTDYVNSTLDIGYTILFHIIDSMLGIYGFDTYRGVLHRNFYMRKSLVCDLVEPFRPLIDLQVRKAINLKQCQEDDFKVFNGRFLLKWECNAKYVSFLMQPLLEHKRDMFLYIQGYYRAFMRQKDACEFPVFNMEE